MENNVKNRAFLWLKLELAFKIYWKTKEEEYPPFNKISLLWFREILFDIHNKGKISSFANIEREKFIKWYRKENRCWWEELTDKELEEWIRERNNEDFSFIVEVLDCYELPEDITDILILNAMLNT